MQVFKTNIFKLSVLSVITVVYSFSSAFGQDTIRNKKGGGYLFTIVKDEDTTSVKNQGRSGTCWSFSTLSFIESELLRMGKGKHNLSEMFIVRNTYSEKAKQYVRNHGHVNFSAGGAFHDVTNMIAKYGMVPESVYKGLNYGEDNHKHGELDLVLKGMVEAVVKNKNKRLTTVWHNAIEAVLDVYLGTVPTEFEYEGKKYTPKTFASSMGIDASNYVEISSYTHVPFYEKFILEVPDNWSWDAMYNVPLDEMMSTIDNAIDQGYTVAWAADVSDEGFSFKQALAVMPEFGWEDLDADEKEKVFKKPCKPMKVTQEIRQKAYDNYETTDDHGMHITGIAKDQKGNKFYIVKNSWGTQHNDCSGYLFASEAFVRYKTMDIMVHKDAIPKTISKKLELKK